MKHAHSYLFTGFIFIAGSLMAQTRQKLQIDEVTLFIKGAELVSRASLNLAKGENEILFSNVAGDVDDQSLTVNATNGVIMESATFQNNYLADETLSPQAREIKDSIELLNAGKDMVNNKIEVIQEQIALLQANRKVGGDNTGLSVTELGKMLDLVNTRMDTYLAQKAMEEALLKKTDLRLDNLKKQLEEEQKKGYQPGGALRIKFYCKDATTTTVTINYIVTNAGWTPTYDIFSDDITNPVRLQYKANIYQNCGVNWTNVHLGISTGNPTEGVQSPVLNPWYLSFAAPQNVYSNLRPNATQSAEDVFIGGARSSGNLYIIDGVQVQGTTGINNFVSVDNSGVNTTFDIDLPYTIPTDGQQHLVAVKKYELPATYRYFTAPKIDKDAFLQAAITNWEDLNLLPGTTNIFYEGTYVGQGRIDVRNLKDTMYISLGRDKKIIVKRERDVKLRSVKMIGSNVRETFAYTLSIRNTRKEPITLIVQDQQPVSNDNSISVEDKDTGDSEYDEKTGLMTWNTTVASNETKKLTLGFTLKYPKGKTLAN